MGHHTCCSPNGVVTKWSSSLPGRQHLTRNSATLPLHEPATVPALPAPHPLPVVLLHGLHPQVAHVVALAAPAVLLRGRNASTSGKAIAFKFDAVH